MSFKRTKKALANFAEDLVAKNLQRQGWSIIDRNYCCRGSELDLIVCKAQSLVFVEVKFRSNFADSEDDLLSMVTREKLKTIYRGAEHFLGNAGQKYCNHHWRVDFAVVFPLTGEKHPFGIRYIVSPQI